MVLIYGMMTDARGLGGLMLAFRLLHPYTIIVLSYALYVPDRFYVLPETLRAVIQRMPLHKGFMLKNVPPVALLLLASACDVSVLQLMPWEESKFYTQSMGYPSMDLMLICMSVKMVQSLVSVVCQLAYLSYNRDANDPTMSNQARALFGISIALSIVTLTMGAVILLLKWSLLKKISREEDGKRKWQGAARRKSSLELSDVYGQDGGGFGMSGRSTTDVLRIENPLHTEVVRKKDEELQELKATVAKLKATVAAQAEEIDRLHQRNLPVTTIQTLAPTLDDAECRL
jgi:hypothetical protein